MGRAEKSKTFLQECIEKIVSSWQKRRKIIRRRWQSPFIFIEWICEGVSNLLKKWAFLDILGHAGRLTILIAVIFYIKGCPERRKQAENQLKAKHYQAWQVFNAAYGKPGSGGRKDALQDLNEDRISLAGIDVSNAKLPRLDLHDAHLRDANFFNADLYQTNFSKAKLMMTNFSVAQLGGANFSHSYLRDSDLSGAKLQYANLYEADLVSANLSGAVLLAANLASTHLTAANLTGAFLKNVDLSGAHLTDANFQEANLSGSNLNNINAWKYIKSIESANIYDVKNPPEGFVEWALEHGAVIIEDGNEWNKLIQDKKQLK